MKPDYPLSLQEFKEIYSKVPRLTIEVLLFDKSRGVFLTLRDIEPCKGLWHMPGGAVFYGEALSDSVARVAKKELGINVKQSRMIDYIEYPSHYKNGMDHPVGLVFEITEYEGTPRSVIEARAGKWFSKLPENMHADQATWLVEHQYIKA